jgi:hypothetical protein
MTTEKRAQPIICLWQYVILVVTVFPFLVSGKWEGYRIAQLYTWATVHIYLACIFVALTPMKGPVWDPAWYELEVKRELLRLGYDPIICCNSTWQNYINETRASDQEYVGAIKELCRRYCLPDDAERLEAKRRHIAKLGIPVNENIYRFTRLHVYFYHFSFYRARSCWINSWKR